MNQPKEYDVKWYILFPALAMMLGWGLRGHIGGGPFGAMIPGAMVAICLGMLLKLPSNSIAILTVFGVVGIGLGGEMTYGQTLGFLRNPETVLWGTTGTTVKGAIWGLLGGAVLAMGFFFNRIPKKTIVVAFLLMMGGMLLGFKLINDPMIIYFSDPANPRPESWAALLFGAIALLIYLNFKMAKKDFKIVLRFALLGMAGGGLGFGLGGLWMVMGSNLPDVIFKSWWKSMEFTFGLLLGVSLGYAAWINRFELKKIIADEKQAQSEITPALKELIVVLIAGVVIHWLIPKLLEPFVESTQNSTSVFMAVTHEIARILVNYAFYGFLLVLVILWYPQEAWQIGITLTFCHTAIDLFLDFFPEVDTLSPFTMYFLFVFLTTTVVAMLVAYFTRKENVVRNMFLLLIWSCIIISFLRMGINPEKLSIAELSFSQIIFGKFVVDIFFAVSAIVVSVMIIRKFQSIQ